jgi:shikimate dehydrogenase
MATAQYGLIGYPLQHSFSPAYFAAKFEKEGIDAIYTAYPLDAISKFPQLLNAHPLRGLNVTIPYKRAVITYLDELDAAAKAIGAVNCIDIRDGISTGYNTDVMGFKNSLLSILQAHHMKALILGTGGASLAVRYVLDELGIAYTSVSRDKKEGTVSYEDLTREAVSEHKLIINTTPLGMGSHINVCPTLAYDAIDKDHLLYDLIYNPEETLFLQKGKEQGAAIKNGLEMLHLQAEASWDIWNR